MKSASIRTKLTIWNVGVLAVALLLLGVVVSYGARKSLLASVDKDMESRTDRLSMRVSQFLSDFPHGERGIIVENVEKGTPRLIIPGIREPVATFQVGAGQYEAIHDPQPPPANDPTRSPFRSRILRLDGRTSSGEGPYDGDAFAAGLKGERVFSEVSIETEPGRKEPARLLTAPVRKGGAVARVIQYPVPLAGTYSALGGITTTLLLVLPAILVVATAGGFFLTGRALKPVREITDTAAQVGAESLSGRLDIKGNDEFSRLALTFNGMLERLQGAFSRMELAVERQRRFTADASHELRTPLTVIKANTSLALRGTRTAEEYKNSLAAVNAAADSMGKLVNDLLLIARSDSGLLEFQREDLCLKPLLKEAIASVSRPGAAKIELQMEDEGIEVSGDGHAITRVFVNLLENAVRHTPESGLIVLEARRVDSEIVAKVRDTGGGIPPEHLPHITDRFYRIDEARTRAHGGSGLGLAICAGILQAHGGSMEIESAVGKGTTVTVKLPTATPTT